jgi:PAS domain S-box-containing protein
MAQKPKASGQVVRDIGDLPDITEAIRMGEARLRSVFRAAPVGIGLVADRVLLEVNDRLCEMTGYSRAELVGQNSRILYCDQQEYDRVGKVKYAEIAERGTGTVQTRWLRKDGATLDVLLSSTPLDPANLAGGVTFTALDITDLKAAEELLRRVSARYEAILAAVPDVIMEVDARKVYTWANRAGLEFFGPDVIGTEAADYFLGEQDTYQVVRPLFNGTEEAVYVESWQRRRDGAKRLLAWWCRPLTGPDGSIYGALSTARDVTDRKRAEEELRARADLERLVAELSTEFISLRPGQIVRGIDRVLERVGLFAGADRAVLIEFSPDGATMSFTHEWLTPGTPSVMAQAGPLPVEQYPNFAARFRAGQMLHLASLADLPPDASAEREFLSRFSVRSVLAVPLSVGGTAFGALGLSTVRQERQWSQETIALLKIVGEMVANALQRDQADRALRSQRDLLERMTETSPAGIVMVDRDGRITFANPAAERVLGLTRQELRQSTFSASAWAAGDGEGGPVVEEQSLLRLVQSTGQPVYDIRQAVLRHDGRRVLLSVNAAPLLDSAGTFDGMVATVSDVTEQVRAQKEREALEDQLRQAQKMEAVGRLAGGIAHDFNNQLTVIKGYCDLMLSGVVEGVTATAELQEIRAAAQRAAGLTSQLLAFSRKQVLQPEVTNINSLLTDMYNPLSRMIGEDIRLSIVADSSLGNVTVDRGQFQQAVMNLVINARDAMPDGGRLTIETANAELGGQQARLDPDVPAGSYVMLAISDTGHGMTAETQAKIFDPFFTTKPAGKGTGLGLSMVYGFVKQSGGAVHVYSEVGKGTTLRVYLPRVYEAGQDAAPAAPAEPVRGGSETILLAEDDQAVRQIAARVLRERGYHVLEAGGAPEATALADRCDGPIHLLITDVVMPSMGGPELARHLQAARPGLAVLFVSGYPANAIDHHGLVDKGVHLLSKPFLPDDLAGMVRQILDGAAAR